MMDNKKLIDKEKLYNTGYIVDSLNDLSEDLYNNLRDNLYKNDMNELIPRYDGMTSDFFVHISIATKEEILKRFNEIMVDIPVYLVERDTPNIYEDIEEHEKRFILLKWAYTHSGESNFDDISYNINFTGPGLKRGELIGSKLKEIVDYINEITNNKLGRSAQKYLTSTYQVQHLDKNDPDITDFQIIYNSIFDLLMNKYYPQIELSTVKPYNLAKTYYSKGCNLEIHEDALGTEHLCVILIYLNNRDYTSDYGGNLHLGGNTLESSDVIVEPQFGNIAILDFNNGLNTSHGVDEVVKGDGRHAILSFISKHN